MNIYIKIILYNSICFYTYATAFADNVHSLEEMMSQYVLLKKEIAQEKVRWKEDKAILFMQRDFLKKGKQHFETSIQKIRGQNSSIVSRIDRLKKEKEDYEQVFKNVRNYLNKLQNEIKCLISSLPESLVTTINPLLARLEIEKELDVIETFKLILICISEIENLENSITLQKEIITAQNGKELEFYVLYIGLTQAYCLSTDYKIAGSGMFKKIGIVWLWDNSLAAQIQNAINIYSKKEVAKLTSLPVQIITGGQR